MSTKKNSKKNASKKAVVVVKSQFDSIVKSIAKAGANIHEIAKSKFDYPEIFANDIFNGDEPKRFAKISSTGKDKGKYWAFIYEMPDRSLIFDVDMLTKRPSKLVSCLAETFGIDWELASKKSGKSSTKKATKKASKKPAIIKAKKIKKTKKAKIVKTTKKAKLVKKH